VHGLETESPEFPVRWIGEGRKRKRTMDEALGEALDLYVETRNGLAQHEDDLEALWKV
jgi:hypothetical protein